MTLRLSYLCLGLFLACSFRAQGTLVFDVNGFYLSDSLKTTATSKTNRVFYNGFLGFSLDKRDFFQVGWSYAHFSTTNDDGTTKITYSSTQMGPGLIWYMDKRRHWRLGLYYHLKVDGDYEKTGASAEEWRGSALAADIGYQIHFSEIYSVAARINYSSSAFNEKFIGSAKTDVSYSRSIIYPSLALTAEF